MAVPERKIEVNWAAQKGDFEADGSLRDIYVQETTVDDWAKVLKFLERSRHEFRLTRGATEIILPEDVGELFLERNPDGALLVFLVAGVELACHFFTTSEIEFDFYPNSVGESELRALLNVMADLGEITGKTVVMTPENMQDAAFFKYEPTTGRVVWIPLR